MPPRKQQSKEVKKIQSAKMSDQLTKLLTCGKCDNLYDLNARRPKMLVCHHSFCMQCIQSFIKNKNNQTAACPTCSKSTSIGRNGVAALPNNEYLWPQLKLMAKAESGVTKKAPPAVDPNVFVSDDEEEEEEEGLDEACGGDFYGYDDSPVHQRQAAVRIFCETCLGVATGECLQAHQICNYEAGIRGLQKRLESAVQEAGENLMNEVQLLEESCRVMGRIQTAWSSVGQSLDQRLVSQTVTLSAAKSMLDTLPNPRLGLDDARSGDPSTLSHAVLSTEGTNSNSEARLVQTRIAANIWKIISNCHVNLYTTDPDAPEEQLFSIQLTQDANNELMCAMYSLSKVMESKKEKNEEKERAEGGASSSSASTSEPKQKYFAAGNSEWVQAKKGRGGEGAIPKKFDPMAKLKIPRNVSSGCLYCFFDLFKGNDKLGRVIMEINCKAAPKMARNFLDLCTGKFGLTYQGCEVWRIPAADHIDGGDLSEKTDEGPKMLKKPFYGDASCLQDAVGMLRMRGMGTSEEGQPIVSSQFMVWVRARKFKSYARTLVFGRVVDGLDTLGLIPETRNRIIIVRKCGMME